MAAGSETSKDVVVRRADASDAGELARLRFAFRAEVGDRIVEDEGAFLLRCTRWMESRLESETRWQCWVAQRERHIVGHVWLQIVEKVPNPVDEPEEHAYITNMHVVESERGRGTGSLLLDAALRWCRLRGIDAAILWPSQRSRPFYERHGFAVREDLMQLVVTSRGP